MTSDSTPTQQQPPSVELAGDQKLRQLFWTGIPRATAQRILSLNEAHAPRRIQRRRTTGWRMPDGAVYVGRPSRWGNPFTVEAVLANAGAVDRAEARAVAVEWFQTWLTDRAAAEAHDVYLDERADILEHLDELTGHDLACWCPLEGPCHADVLLALANPAGEAP